MGSAFATAFGVLFHGREQQNLAAAYQRQAAREKIRGRAWKCGPWRWKT